MEFTVLMVPGCPHAALLDQRLDRVLADLDGTDSLFAQERLASVPLCITPGG
jgi:hypothetical protein